MHDTSCAALTSTSTPTTYVMKYGTMDYDNEPYYDRPLVASLGWREETEAYRCDWLPLREQARAQVLWRLRPRRRAALVVRHRSRQVRLYLPT